jgi:hypothetical protein
LIGTHGRILLDEADETGGFAVIRPFAVYGSMSPNRLSYYRLQRRSRTIEIKHITSERLGVNLSGLDFAVSCVAIT